MQMWSNTVYETEQLIDADIATVWAILENLNNWGKWNPMHPKLEVVDHGTFHGHIVRERRPELAVPGTHLIVTQMIGDENDPEGGEREETHAEVTHYLDAANPNKRVLQWETRNYFSNYVRHTYRLERVEGSVGAGGASEDGARTLLVHTEERPWASCHKCAYPLLKSAMERADEGLRIEAESMKNRFAARNMEAENRLKAQHYKNRLDETAM
jgi:hypothetical protein